MRLIILLYFLQVQHVSGTTIPSSEAHEYNVDYHIGRLVLGLL